MNFQEVELDKLRRLAKKHGFIIKQGRKTGEGNIREMLSAIASDDLAVVRLVKAGQD